MTGPGRVVTLIGGRTMATPSACGNRQLVEALLEDRLSPEHAAQLAAHLEGCEACREEFDRLAAGSRWWSDLRQFARPGTGPEASGSPTWTPGDARLGRPTGGGLEEGPDDDLPLDFLGASEK